MAGAPNPDPIAQELFDRVVERARPDRVAVMSPDGALTYAQLLERAEGLAERLDGDESPVVVYGHKEPALIASFLAAVRRGRGYVPADPVLPSTRILRMLDQAHPGAIISTQPLPAEVLAAVEARGLVHIQSNALADRLTGGAQPWPRKARNGTKARPGQNPGERPAYIMFTSGTTGDPKGVPVPYRALAHFASWLQSGPGIRPGVETFLNQAPFNFDLSVMDLYGALLSGGTLFSITRDEVADPRRLFARLGGAPLTVWVSTPSFARFCLAEPRFDRTMLPALRCFLFCGETLSPATARELHARFPGADVWNTYGPTETTVAVTALRVTTEMTARDRPLPVGRPIPEVDVWIADPSDPERRLEAGASGEIVIAGPQVALGYLLAGAPNQTSDLGRFYTAVNGRLAYRTGDRGHFDPSSGLLFCDGRLDRQVKLHGYRLELEEIETYLRRIQGVGDGAVLTVNRNGQPDHLVAFVVPGVDGHDQLPADGLELTQLVRRALGKNLPFYALPRQVFLVSDPPLTPNGKLDRRALETRLR